MQHTARLLVREVLTVRPTETVHEVVRLMKAKHVGCVLVVEGERLVGIFSERDLVTRVAVEEADLRGAPVSRFMTPDPRTVDAAEPLEKVFELLSRRRFRHVPITEGGKPVGIVSLSDFAGILPEVFSEEKYTQYFVGYWDRRRG